MTYTLTSSELDAELARALDAATAAGRFDGVEAVVSSCGTDDATNVRSSPFAFFQLSLPAEGVRPPAVGDR